MMRKWFGHQAGDLKPGVYDQHGNDFGEFCGRREPEGRRMNCGRDLMCGKGILVFSLINLLWASGAEAMCRGIGTAWHCRAGTTSAEISRALRKAPDGATLTFRAGSYSWDSFISF